MAGLTLTLETAKGALLNSQKQMQTTSHNIANADNKAYARQKAVPVANIALRTGGGWIGTGAHVSRVVQLRDQFIEQRLMKSIAGESEYETLSSQIDLAQNLLSDDGEKGISQSLGAFWDSWDTLVQNPTGTPEQTGVYQATQSVVSQVRNTYDDLSALADEEIPEMISEETSEINGLLSKIAGYNQHIMRSEHPNYTANDLRDSRYQALRDLSEHMSFRFKEEPNGSISITTGGSDEITLVHEGQAGSLSYDSASHLIAYEGHDGNVAMPSKDFPGGSLEGLLTARDKVKGYLDELNNFARSLITEVNHLHSQNNGSTVFSGTDAADIAMIDNFLSGQNASEEAERALSLTSLQNTRVTFSDGTTSRYSDYLSDLQQQVGMDHQSALSQAEFNTSLRFELDAQQQSVSGVSIDEEMVDLLKHQQLYQAAAKVIQQTAGMLDKIIEMV